MKNLTFEHFILKYKIQNLIWIYVLLQHSDLVTAWVIYSYAFQRKTQGIYDKPHLKKYYFLINNTGKSLHDLYCCKDSGGRVIKVPDPTNR